MKNESTIEVESLSIRFPARVKKMKQERREERNLKPKNRPYLLQK